MADTITSVVTQEVITSVNDVETITESDESEIITSEEVAAIYYTDRMTIYTAKDSATDSGTRGDMAFDDDYIYVCTTTGAAGAAIWKKTQ